MSMTAVNAINPVALLREIEDRCRGHAAELPRKAEAGQEWSGVGFRIGDSLLLARLGEVVEILEVPELSRVPLTRPWVMGVANVRGNLLPVIDVQGMLNGNMTRVTARTRVLVVDYEGIYSGLIVDEVLGLKHFTDGEFTDEPAVVEDYLHPSSFEPWASIGAFFRGRSRSRC